LKLFDLSSSGPPGACITPSNVINSWTIIFLISLWYQIIDEVIR
jgi:hypothetical protein